MGLQLKAFGTVPCCQLNGTRPFSKYLVRAGSMQHTPLVNHAFCKPVGCSTQHSCSRIPSLPRGCGIVCILAIQWLGACVAAQSFCCCVFGAMGVVPCIQGGALLLRVIHRTNSLLALPSMHQAATPHVVLLWHWFCVLSGSSPCGGEACVMKQSMLLSLTIWPFGSAVFYL